MNGRSTRFVAAMFDVDGVLVASSHERGWREALAGYADAARFTTEFHQAHVAGKPRLNRARSALEELGVPEAAPRPPEYELSGRDARRSAGGMAALGSARLGDEALLHAAEADLVGTSLDQVDVAAIANGALRIRPELEKSADG